MKFDRFNEERDPYEGFLINVVIYFAALIVASFGAIVMRTVGSVFIHTPSLVDLRADASYLFDSVYPLQAILTTAGFLGMGFLSCYFIAYRIARKNGKKTDPFKMKLQIALPAVLASLVNIGNGVMREFNGVFGMQFWYPAAALTRLFGGIKDANVLAEVSTRDLMNNSFIYQTLAFKFLPQTLAIAVIECVAFGFLAYFGRKKGMERGLRAREQYLDEVHGKK
ncbi:MAG: hypothetical protein IJK33_07630 [Clostridia bacterium]|nr:hypothetical protein [Clostridia bacterium]